LQLGLVKTKYNHCIMRYMGQETFTNPMWHITALIGQLMYCLSK